MSAAAVRAVLTRAVAEPEYRALLLARPDQATATYELTEGEFAHLRNLKAESFDALGADLERRESRSVNNLNSQNNMIVGDPIRHTNTTQDTSNQQIVGDT